MSVIDNPLESKFKGRSLLGAYQVDDEEFPHRKSTSSPTAGSITTSSGASP